MAMSEPLARRVRSPVQGDPVAPHRTMLAVADAVEDAAVTFDRAGRGDVVRKAGYEDAVNSQGGAGLREHLAQGPARQPRRRAEGRTP